VDERSRPALVAGLSVVSYILPLPTVAMVALCVFAALCDFTFLATSCPCCCFCNVYYACT
jgi:hypothetical protein